VTVAFLSREIDEIRTIRINNASAAAATSASKRRLREPGLMDPSLLVGMVAASGALRNERRTSCGTFFCLQAENEPDTPSCKKKFHRSFTMTEDELQCGDSPLNRAREVGAFPPFQKTEVEGGALD
jgi:hypothetical protein